MYVYISGDYCSIQEILLSTLYCWQFHTDKHSEPIYTNIECGTMSTFQAANLKCFITAATALLCVYCCVMLQLLIHRVACLRTSQLSSKDQELSPFHGSLLLKVKEMASSLAMSSHVTHGQSSFLSSTTSLVSPRAEGSMSHWVVSSQQHWLSAVLGHQQLLVTVP